MDMEEDTRLMKGFRCAPVTPCGSRLSMPDFQMANKILMGCKFEEWDEFDTETSKVASQLCETLRKRGCHPDNSSTSHCRGEFQVRSCENTGCTLVASYKRDNLNRPPTCNTAMAVHTWDLLLGLEELVKDLRSGWNREREVRKQLIITQEADLDDVITIKQPAQFWPDTVFVAKCPNISPIFPETSDGKSIVSRYSDLCEGITESCELSYPLKNIGMLIKLTLFGRSGYGCLYSHNQAVFVKMCPNITETREGIKVEHRVMMSREYKCDGEVSTLHGLLTMMIKGFEESSDEKRRMLDNYFRQIEASTVTSSGGLFIQMSCKRVNYEPSDQNGVIDDGKKTKWEEDRKGRWDEYVEVSEEAREKVRRALRGGEAAVLNETDMIRIFITRSKPIMSGGSGTVLWSEVEGVKVAVKRWNWKMEYGELHGLSWLLKEILVYKKLTKYDAEMMGSVVPRLIATFEYPEREVVLVTEYVGSTLREMWPRVDGKLNFEVDGVKLRDRDLEEIEKSATEGLQRLKRCGIYHRDMLPKNVRVERVKEARDGRRWRTWWIDLGLVKLLDEEKFGDLTRVKELHIDPDDEDEEWWNSQEPVLRLFSK